MRNRLPSDFLADAIRPDATGVAVEGAAVEIMAEAHARDAVTALLHLLTRLANCGLDAGAPSLMHSARSET